MKRRIDPDSDTCVRRRRICFTASKVEAVASLRSIREREANRQVPRRSVRLAAADVGALQVALVEPEGAAHHHSEGVRLGIRLQPLRGRTPASGFSRIVLAAGDRSVTRVCGRGIGATARCSWRLWWRRRWRGSGGGDCGTAQEQPGGVCVSGLEGKTPKLKTGYPLRSYCRCQKPFEELVIAVDSLDC